MKAFVIFGILLASLPTLYAQGNQTGEKPQPMPSGPLIRLRAPDFARWIVTENPVQADAQNALPFQRRVAVTKTKSIILEQILDQLGRREKWCVGDLQFSMSPTLKKYLVYDKSSFRNVVVDRNLYTDYSKTDFPGFEWITPANYVDIKNVMKRECIVFERAGEGEGKRATACVDLATRFPVVLQEGTRTTVYEFKPAPPQQLLPIPAEIQKQLQEAGVKLGQSTAGSPAAR